MFIEGSKCLWPSIFTKDMPDFFESESKMMCAGPGSQVQDRYEHTGANPEKGLEGAGQCVLYLIRRSKGDNKRHN